MDQEKNKILPIEFIISIRWIAISSRWGVHSFDSSGMFTVLNYSYFIVFLQRKQVFYQNKKLKIWKLYFDSLIFTYMFALFNFSVVSRSKDYKDNKINWKESNLVHSYILQIP